MADNGFGHEDGSGCLGAHYTFAQAIGTTTEETENGLFGVVADVRYALPPQSEDAPVCAPGMFMQLPITHISIPRGTSRLSMTPRRRRGQRSSTTASSRIRVEATLAKIMGLRPLDRLQFSALDVFGVEQSRQNPPFWYFQRYLDGNLMEVRAPNGVPATICIHDAYDVRQGSPIVVKARTATDCVADAYVLYASRDRFGDADLYVSFLDVPSGAPQRASLVELDRPAVARMAKSHVMPVCSARASQAQSADRGESRHRDDCRREVQTFIGHAISSDRDKCEKSACAS